jgi:hypothetical protein
MRKIFALVCSPYFEYIHPLLARAWSKTGRDWFAQMKWICTNLMNDYSWTRVFYPLFQLIVWQRVWMVTDEKNEKWQWFFARSAEKAACYWAEQYCTSKSGKAIVRRPLDKTSSRWSLEYIEHTQYGASRLLDV